MTQGTHPHVGQAHVDHMLPTSLHAPTWLAGRALSSYLAFQAGGTASGQHWKECSRLGAESGSTHLEVGPEASGEDGDGQVQGRSLLVLALPLLKGLLLLARELQIRHHALHLRMQAFKI